MEQDVKVYVVVNVGSLHSGDMTDTCEKCDDYDEQDDIMEHLSDDDEVTREGGGESLINFLQLAKIYIQQATWAQMQTQCLVRAEGFFFKYEHLKILNSIIISNKI